MNDPKRVEGASAPTSKNSSALLIFVYTLMGLVLLAVAALITWAIVIEPNLSSSTSSTTISADCSDGSINTLPSGYTWYENSSLGYKFAYPSSWGIVTMATTPTGGTSGHYAQGSFTNKSTVSFGGNATDYVVNARGGTPLDNPGFLQAGDGFYTVQIWQLHDSATGIDTPQYALSKIEDSSTTTATCNTSALTTQYAYSDYYSFSYDLARVNLQPPNIYYGVNFLLENPTTADRSDLENILASFQTF